MNSILISILILLTLALPVGARMTSVVAGGGVAAASSGQNFSDDFSGTLGNWTVSTGTAAISSGVLSLSTAGWDPIVLTYNTSTNTVSQYMKFSLPSASETYPIAVFRYVNSSSGFYAIEFSTPFSCEVEWRYFEDDSDIGSGDVIGASVDMGTCSNGDTFGITVTGTGTDTIVRMWHNPTGSSPSAADTWGGDNTPNASWTDNPATACDTGTKVGFAGIQATAGDITFDNFYGGDIP